MHLRPRHHNDRRTQSRGLSVVDGHGKLIACWLSGRFDDIAPAFAEIIDHLGGDGAAVLERRPQLLDERAGWIVATLLRFARFCADGVDLLRAYERLANADAQTVRDWYERLGRAKRTEKLKLRQDLLGYRYRCQACGTTIERAFPRQRGRKQRLHRRCLTCNERYQRTEGLQGRMQPRVGYLRCNDPIGLHQRTKIPRDLPLDDFYRDGNGRFQRQCRYCKREMNKRRRIRIAQSPDLYAKLVEQERKRMRKRREELKQEQRLAAIRRSEQVRNALGFLREHGWTIGQIADHIGAHRVTIWKWAVKGAIPSREYVELLAQLINDIARCHSQQTGQEEDRKR
ncbi:MAG: hypothetical protein C4321_00745 [Chloroflexota bacterium]